MTGSHLRFSTFDFRAGSVSHGTDVMGKKNLCDVMIIAYIVYRIIDITYITETIFSYVLASQIYKTDNLLQKWRANYVNYDMLCIRDE